jgi:hypothetical protein
MIRTTVGLMILSRKGENWRELPFPWRVSFHRKRHVPEWPFPPEATSRTQAAYGRVTPVTRLGTYMGEQARLGFEAGRDLAVQIGGPVDARASGAKGRPTLGL